MNERSAIITQKGNLATPFSNITMGTTKKTVKLLTYRTTSLASFLSLYLSRDVLLFVKHQIPFTRPPKSATSKAAPEGRVILKVSQIILSHYHASHSHGR
jgi:hypothetical protein